MKKISIQEQKLFDSLKNNFNCKQQHWDGHKHVDIRIYDAQLDIEIDGDEHYLRPERIIADIKREQFSLKDDYYTIHIPNRIVDKNLKNLSKQ